MQAFAKSHFEICVCKLAPLTARDMVEAIVVFELVGAHDLLIVGLTSRLVRGL